MKRILFFFFLVPALLFGQGEPQVFPPQIRGDGTTTSILTSSTSATAWQTQAAARAGLNYWTENSGSLSRNSMVGVGFTGTPATTFDVAGVISARTSTYDGITSEAIRFSAPAYPTSYFNGVFSSISVAPIGNRLEFRLCDGTPSGQSTVLRLFGTGTVQIPAFTTQGNILRHDASGYLQSVAPDFNQSGSGLFRETGTFALGLTSTAGYWVEGAGYNDAKAVISYSDNSTVLNSAKAGLVIHNSSQTQGNMSILAFGTDQIDPNRVAPAMIYGIHQPNAPRSSGYQQGELGFAVTGPNFALKEAMRLSEGGLRIPAFSVANQLLRADASGNITQTLPAISTASTTTTLDFSSNIVKLKSLDEIREEIGAAAHLYRKLTDGTMRRPQLVSNPATIQAGSEWYDLAAHAPTWAVGSTAADVRHAASIEENIEGTGPLAFGASFTVGANPRNYCQVADANTAAITVTLDVTMALGQVYRIPLRRNSTNSITFTVPAGSTLDAGGSSLNDTPFVAAAHRVIFVVRESDTLYTLMQSGN